ncbi:MAG: helix-turn-helix domain-containing protein, partial [Anaerolineae bacterium]
MSELGEMLRKAREKKGVSLAQVEEVTRIRQKFLRALEEGERDSLPEEVYVRAFLRSYARYLDLSPDEVISLYSGREETPAQEVPPPRPLSTAFRPLDLSLLPTPWLSPGWAIAIAAAIITFALLTACGIWVVRRYFISEPPSKVVELATPTLEASMRSDTSTPEIGTEPFPTPSSIPPSPTATSTSTPTPTVTPTPTPKAYTGIEIEMIIYEKAWLRVV